MSMLALIAPAITIAISMSIVSNLKIFSAHYPFSDDTALCQCGM